MHYLLWLVVFFADYLSFFGFFWPCSVVLLPQSAQLACSGSQTWFRVYVIFHCWHFTEFFWRWIFESLPLKKGEILEFARFSIVSLSQSSELPTIHCLKKTVKLHDLKSNESWPMSSGNIREINLLMLEQLTLPSSTPLALHLDPRPQEWMVASCLQPLG